VTSNVKGQIERKNWMTLNSYKFEFSWNFARFRISGRQQRLNEWR